MYVIQLIATMLLGNEHGIELRESTTVLLVRYAYISCLSLLLSVLPTAI